MNTIMEKEYVVESIGRTFKASVLLPDDYEVLHSQRYPVVYAIGIPFLFDANPKTLAHWNVKLSLDAMKKSHLIDGVIVVSLTGDVHFMMEDYLHNLNQGIFKDHFNKNKPFISNAKDVATFIVQTLKPSIDQNFRTLPDLESTGIMGVHYSSIFALYMLSEYAHVFSKVGLFSMPLWLISNEIFLRAEQLVLAEHTSIYHYIAEKETLNWVKNQYAIYLVKKLNQILYRKCNRVKFVVGFGENADETMYRERFPEFILHVFRK
jgi:predicted alpha/beta superfamily hydrolase